MARCPRANRFFVSPLVNAQCATIRQCNTRMRVGLQCNDEHRLSFLHPADGFERIRIESADRGEKLIAVTFVSGREFFSSIDTSHDELQEV